MSGDMGINTSLRESLLQIARTAHDDTLSSQQKSENLAKLVEPVLVMLAEKISDVGGTRRVLLSELKEMIQSGAWAALPEPGDVGLTLDKINKISAAISDAKDRIAVDATELSREMLEIMRKMMLENKFSQTTQHKLDINAAEAAKTEREIANKKQLSSELASAIAQGIGGIAGLAGAAVSLKSVKTSAANAMGATELAGGIVKGQKVAGKSLDDLENAAGAAKNKLTDLNKKILSEQKELEELKKLGAKRALPAQQKSRKAALEARVGIDGDLLTKRAMLRDELKQTQTAQKNLANRVETLRKDADINVAKANAIQSLTGSISSLANSAGGIAAALEKQASAAAQQKSDQQNINREVAQKMYQAASDSASSAREALRSAMAMISAIEQTYASMSSLLARNSV